MRRREKQIRRALSAAGVESLPLQAPKLVTVATAESARRDAVAEAADKLRKTEEVDLFSWRETRQPSVPSEGEARRFRADNHFAAYLATTGFSTRALGPGDSRVRRARAVVAILILLALVFVLWHLLVS